ncbi:Hypothetical protein FKW44_003369, partial [Caligus rogercresseyi]
IHALLNDEDLLMATLTHPNHGPFMLKHVAPCFEEDIKKRLIREIVISIIPDTLPSSKSKDMVTEKTYRSLRRLICIPGEHPSVIEEDGPTIEELIRRRGHLGQEQGGRGDAW